jgi:hypothetical protein
MSRLLIILALIPSWAHAQTITLPLDGYFRPGAYMPVWVDSRGPVSVTADSTVTTHHPGGSSLAPVFVYSAVADHVTCGDEVARLHALSDNDRLVGFTTRDDALVSALFPSNHVVPIELNTANALIGPPIAWDSLDAAILDSIDSQKIGPLLATGMMLAVRSDVKPDNTWPWQRVADAWVLRPPTSDQPALLGEDAYSPTFAWRAQRTRAVLAACLMLGLALSRSRWNLIALAGFSVLFCAGFVAWRSKQSDVLTMSRNDQIIGEITQTDRWTYQMSPATTHAEFTASGVTWPVVASPAHAQSLQISLNFDPSTGGMRFDYTLPAYARIAFVTRSCSATANEPAKR